MWPKLFSRVLTTPLLRVKLRKSIKDLSKFRGIGEAKAISIVAALELGRRRKEQDRPQRAKVTCSRDAYNEMIQHLIDKPHEEFWISLMNRANEIYASGSN